MHAKFCLSAQNEILIYYITNNAIARSTNTQPLNQLRLRFALGLLSKKFLTVPAKKAMEPNTMKVATTNSTPRIADQEFSEVYNHFGSTKLQKN